jgi:hypothetical protein
VYQSRLPCNIVAGDNSSYNRRHNATMMRTAQGLSLLLPLVAIFLRQTAAAEVLSAVQQNELELQQAKVMCDVRKLATVFSTYKLPDLTRSCHR